MFDLNVAGRIEWSRKWEDGGASTRSDEKFSTCSNGRCGLLTRSACVNVDSVINVIDKREQLQLLLLHMWQETWLTFSKIAAVYCLMFLCCDCVSCCARVCRLLIFSLIFDILCTTFEEPYRIVALLLLNVRTGDCTAESVAKEMGFFCVAKKINWP